MTGNTPWVIPSTIFEGLIEYYSEDDENLLKKIPADQKDLMLNNDRWWSSDPYNSLPVAPINIRNLKQNFMLLLPEL
jgi:hypothetical protein